MLRSKHITKKKLDYFCKKCKSNKLQNCQCPFENDRLSCTLLLEHISDMYAKYHKESEAIKPPSYYINGLRLLGYTGEVRKSRTVRI